MLVTDRSCGFTSLCCKCSTLTSYLWYVGIRGEVSSRFSAGAEWAVFVAACCAVLLEVCDGL